jgi:oligopeptide/dipeptide ABC transporter ATP-binding protein
MSRGDIIAGVTDATKQYAARDGRGIVRAVDGVSLSIRRGETFGLVGESGSGKSTLGRLLLRLLPVTSGRVFADGEDVTTLSEAALRPRRRDMQIVFQDPYASLDPRMTIGAIIAEPLDVHRIGDRASRKERVAELLRLVGLDAAAASRYPHEFSGGQRQRIGIARAIATEPKLIVLDEPVSALDLSIQSQILNLLMDLKAKLSLTYVLISHDLAVIEHMSDRIGVMYLGRIVEIGEATDVLARPKHPYTEALLSAAPVAEGGRRRQRIILSGDQPSPEHIPHGCRFHPRCPRAFDRCRIQAPRAIGRADGGYSECHLAET